MNYGARPLRSTRRLSNQMGHQPRWYSITNAASVSLAASIAAGGGGSGSVTSVFGRAGAVVAQSTDYSAYYDTNGKAAAASTAAITASDPAGLAASVKSLSLQIVNNLSDVADAGTSRQDIHIPALTPVAAVQTASVGSFLRKRESGFFIKA